MCSEGIGAKGWLEDIQALDLFSPVVTTGSTISCPSGSSSAAKQAELAQKWVGDGVCSTCVVCPVLSVSLQYREGIYNFTQGRLGVVVAVLFSVHAIGTARPLHCFVQRVPILSDLHWAYLGC